MATSAPKPTLDNDMPPVSSVVTYLRTSLRREKYVWTIQIDPTLIRPEGSCSVVRVPDQKFKHGSLSKIDHVCAANINRTDGGITILCIAAGEILGTVVKNLHFDLSLLEEGKAVAFEKNVEADADVIPDDSKDKSFSKSFLFGELWTKKVDSIEVVMHVLFENEPVGRSVAAYGVDAHPLRDSSNIYLDFYGSSFLSDVKIVCNDIEIPAHKLLLSRCSPVFLAMFKSENKETLENMVVIDDNLEAVRQMLKWMYTGNLDKVDLQALFDLYKLVHRYQILELKQTCAKRICNQIKSGTALEIYLLGKVYDDIPLVDVARATIKRNKSAVFADPQTYSGYFEKYPEFMKTILTDD